jgi:hypothetical protein
MLIPEFETLMITHHPTVLRTACRLLGRIEDAEDAAQQVFLRLLRSRSEWRDVGPWLYRVTVNVCNDFYRRRKLMTELSPKGRYRPRSGERTAKPANTTHGKGGFRPAHKARTRSSRFAPHQGVFCRGNRPDSEPERSNRSKPNPRSSGEACASSARPPAAWFSEWNRISKKPDFPVRRAIRDSTASIRKPRVVEQTEFAENGRLRFPDRYFAG